MDIRQIIASGILESYALGLADEQERREVEQYLDKYPEVAAELQSIETALELYARGYQLPPPAGTQEKILERVRATKSPGTAPVQHHGSVLTKLFWPVAAMLLLALASTIYLYQQQNDLHNQLASTQNQLNQLNRECDDVKATNTSLLERIVVLRDPATQNVPMGGTNLSPSSKAVVFWNPAVQKSYLNAGNLPAPPSDKQYQLWAIVEGTPVDMGVFNVQSGVDGLQEVPFITSPGAFAVTLEPIGGSTNPTLEQMYVLGELSLS